MAFWTDLVGTVSGYIRLGLTGPRLKNDGGHLVVRSNVDGADAEITAAKLNVSGDAIELNSDAADEAGDWKYTLMRPPAGMMGAVTLILPPGPGTAGYAMLTDGTGVMSWGAAGNTAPCSTMDTTAISFASVSPVAAMTLPPDAIVDEVEVIVDVPFDGMAPQMSVGIAGNLAKYMGVTGNNLTADAQTRFVSHPNNPPEALEEAIVITLNPDSSTVGSARVLITFSIPS
jgi:hypothetical protein